MAERENSAFRLYRFIQSMTAQPDNLATSHVLLVVLGVEKGSTPRQQNAMLSKATDLLFTELESLVGELKRNDYSDEAIRPIAAPFDALSPVQFAQAWKVNKTGFAASLPVLRSIGETPNLLTDDGAAISKEDLAELSADVAILRQEVQNSNLPQQVKDFIYHQLEIITSAIRDYPLAGLKAFKSAAKDAIFHEFEHADILTQYRDTPQITGLKAIQAKVIKVAKFSIDLSKFLSAMDTVYHHGEAVLHAAAVSVQHLSGWTELLKK